MEEFWKCYITNASFSVDIFFFISGFLAFFYLVHQIEREGGIIGCWRQILHRIIRLGAIFFLLTIVHTWLLPVLIEGPIAFKFYLSNNQSCLPYWWGNFLFISCFFSPDYQCLGHTWYIHNDMIFFVILVFIALAYCHSRKLGAILLLSLTAGSLIVTYYFCFTYSLSASLKKFTNDYFLYYYDKPWARCLPYFIGVFASMLYISNKRGERSWKTSFSQYIRRNNKLRWGLYIISIAVMFMLIHTMYWLNKYPNEWSQVQDILYLTLHKPLFIVCFFFISHSALIGKCSAVRSIFGHWMMEPFAKLGLCAYIIHPILMEYHIFCEKKGDYFDYEKNLLKFCGYAMLAYGFSLFMTAIYESPFRSLSKRYLRAFDHPTYPSVETGDCGKLEMSNESGVEFSDPEREHLSS